MAEFPIERARQKLGFTPSTAVRADIDVRTGEGAVGAAIGQALITGTELYIRKKKMDDALVRDEAIQIRKSAELEIELFREQNADTRLWSKQAEEVLEKVTNKISGLGASREMTQINNLETLNWRSQKGTAFLIDEVKQKKEDTKTVMVDEIIEAYRLADPEKIHRANKNFDSNSKGIFSPDEARIIKRNATTVGFKGYFKDRAGRNAEGTIATLNKEIKARESGNGKIPEEVMTNSELRESIGVAQNIMKESVVAFENNLNNELIRIDNTPNLSQNDFDLQSELLKNTVLTANIPGTQKRKVLADLEKWRRGTNEIDYAKVLSLNQEMDAAQRSGIVDPTIGDRIVRASLEGAFGGRNKGGQKTYGDMIRRFEKLQFDERVQAIMPIVRTFERENADDPRLIFVFHQAKNKIIAESPDATTKELFIRISALSEAYSVLPEAIIESKMRVQPKQSIKVISPGGLTGSIPADQLERALKEGYKKVE